ncbi:nucleotide sugar dehydrogenase [Fictibacillus sp. KU28468]|uniref:nucleotide sugar dehydrogenase n=1 Tax=Fictibacillus sp. KU28468 TaxID=2991053 RepID=UPI0039F64C58
MGLALSYTCAEMLEDKIRSRQAKVAVIGLGYVGLPTAYEKAKKGYEVIGLDISEEKVNLVNTGITYISDIEPVSFADAVTSKKLSASTDFSMLEHADVAVICVPTPVDEHKQPDLSYIKSAADQIDRYGHEGMLVILESTTYPGTTDEYLRSRLAEKGFIMGENFFLAYSPERVDPGNKSFGISNTPKIVGGTTPVCTSLAAAFIGENAHPVSSLEVAEMAKVFENTFRYINIALVNETAQFCSKSGIDIWEVVDASGSKPYGFMPFYPGPGVGGHCIPVDPYYLTYKAQEVMQSTKMIELAGEINDGMVTYIYQRLSEALNEESKAVKGSTIAVLGAAYKPDIGDLRESPVLPLLSKLQDNGARLSIIDPYVESFVLDGEIITSYPYSDEMIQEADLVLLATNHSIFDYERIAGVAKVIFDTRNAFKNVSSMKARYYKL